MTELEGTLKRIAEIRREHYPLMVSTLVDYLQLHGDPLVIERALREACQMEIARVEFEREYNTGKGSTPHE